MQLFRALLSAVLCLSLADPAALAAAPITPQTQTQPSPSPPHHAQRPAYQSTQLKGNARILHALNRFTFGPRPGDLDAVRSFGLEAWFDSQLHPESLDQSALDAHLAQFPAMQWTTEDLLFRLPSNAIIRQAIDGKLQVPERGALHAVYENQIFRVEAKRQEQDQKKAAALQQLTAANAAPAAATPAATTENAATMDAATQSPSMSPAPPDTNQLSMAPVMPNANLRLDEGLYRTLADLPPAQRVARLAVMQQPQFDDFVKSLRPPQRAALAVGLDPNLKEVALALENPQRLVNEELIAQRLTRDIYSTAQLQEVMTDFWLNHFNVFLHKNDETPYYLVSYERDIIRPRALGKFEDLLEATAHSPAMLLYLDNVQSIGPHSLAAERASSNAARNSSKKSKAPEGLNENYARELMELHTLGVNGGYTQADVTQVARILTGWTVDRPQRGGDFRFEPNRHDPGTKVVLGHKFKEHGELEGRDLLRMLASSPATAHFICRKLAIRFVSDDPPQALVDRMAQSYLASSGDIARVLQTLFHSPEFWESADFHAKVKTPVEFVVSAARASGANISNLQPLANAMREMGMPLYGCATPNGYSWQSDTWVSTNALVNRMNFALSLAANRLPGITVTWDSLPGANTDPATSSVSVAAPSPQSEELRLESMLLSGGVSDTTRSAVLQQFEQQSAQALNDAASLPLATAPRPKFANQPISATEKQDQILAGLLLGSPEFQRR